MRIARAEGRAVPPPADDRTEGERAPRPLAAGDAAIDGGAAPIDRAPVRAADLALAGLVAAVVVGGTLVARGRPDAIGYVLLVGGAAPLAIRRQLPVMALTFTALFAFAYDALDQPAALYTISIAVALFAVSDAGRRLVAIAGVIAIVLGFFAIGAVFGRGHVVELANAAWFAGWLVASLVLGEVTRSRRAYLEEVEHRALEAERTREEEARRLAGEERMRIARELHDVLAHRISLISVQAGVGAHLLDREPAQARASLLAISAASREALQELRTTLGVLRQVDEADPRTPTPGIDRLNRVVADARAAGLDARLEISGEARALPTEVDIAAYRIVQESITNVIRHARATEVTVAIAYRPGEIDIEVTDDGSSDPMAAPVSVGNGLVGMRERATALGGALDFGRRTGSGFRVHARLPAASA